MSSRSEFEMVPDRFVSVTSLSMISCGHFRHQRTDQRLYPCYG